MTDDEIFAHCDAIPVQGTHGLSMLETMLLNALRNAYFIIDEKDWPQTAKECREAIDYAENISLEREKT